MSKVMPSFCLQIFSHSSLVRHDRSGICKPVVFQLSTLKVTFKFNSIVLFAMLFMFVRGLGGAEQPTLLQWLIMQGNYFQMSSGYDEYGTLEKHFCNG